MKSLALKYRPRAFGEVVGQENIITILQNQVKTQQVRQAYLFTGGAGTGKTTVARILADSVNSEVIEIDAASNNGVEQVREMRENCKFKPIGKKFKVYIIDEVHMMSTGAFNALLKTLEEPPAHIIFILATTDPHKIPATIMSRVQKFDFRRLTLEQICARLLVIATNENINIESDALEYIAKLAEGGMRDAITILDTCLGYKEKLEIADVMNILGYVDYFEYIKLVRAVLREDRATIFLNIESIFISGADMKQFIKGLLTFILDVEKVKVLGDFRYVSAPSVYKEQVQELAESDLNYSLMFEKIAALSNRLRYENNAKVLIQGELINLW